MRSSPLRCGDSSDVRFQPPSRKKRDQSLIPLHTPDLVFAPNQSQWELAYSAKKNAATDVVEDKTLLSSTVLTRTSNGFRKTQLFSPVHAQDLGPSRHFCVLLPRFGETRVLEFAEVLITWMVQNEAKPSACWMRWMAAELVQLITSVSLEGSFGSVQGVVDIGTSDGRGSHSVRLSTMPSKSRRHTFAIAVVDGQLCCAACISV